ncbi:hypothetical protein BJV77DRAFT_968269 [Russula vinacea]|nr:hypothetical protein BJV77DRAFT_968269 [Russula vinacea]
MPQAPTATPSTLRGVRRCTTACVPDWPPHSKSTELFIPTPPQSAASTHSLSYSDPTCWQYWQTHMLSLPYSPAHRVACLPMVVAIPPIVCMHLEYFWFYLWEQKMLLKSWAKWDDGIPTCTA